MYYLNGSIRYIDRYTDCRLLVCSVGVSGSSVGDCLQKHCSEDVFRDALNLIMTKHCPAVSWATADTSGVCIQNFQDAVEQLFRSKFWNEKMDFSGPKRRPLIRISSDGTQAGEMFVYNLEITGMTILNLKTRFLQSVNFYVPLAVIPMQESK